MKTKSLLIATALATLLVVSAVQAGPYYGWTHGTGNVAGSGIAHGRGVFRGSGTAHGSGMVLYRDDQDRIQRRQGSGTVSGRGLAVGRGTVAGSGRGWGRGWAAGKGRAWRAY